MHTEAQNMKNLALITGASSGIGEAFARKLASQGFNLIIIARRKKRLQQLADELIRKYSIEIEILSADLAKDQEIEKIEQRIKKSNDITMLINNAGFGTRGYFADVDLTKIVNMINVHIVTSTRLIRAVLPQMIERNKGTIINVSSIVADVPATGRVVYAASKAYLNSISRSLQAEMKEKKLDIKIQALMPGSTRTGFFSTEEYGNRGISNDHIRFTKSPEEVVEGSLALLTKDEVVVIPDPENRKVHSLMVQEGKTWLEAVKIVFK